MTIYQPAHFSVALVVAGGQGLRAGGDVPKQFQQLGGVSVLTRTLEALAAGHIDVIQLVLPPDALEWQPDRPVRAKLLPPVAGGVTRQESVRNGLEAIEAAGGCWHVFIHDAARPFVSPTLISRVMSALEHVDGATPALPVVDSLRASQDGVTIDAEVSRDRLYRVQTPQGFDFRKILAAHRAATGAFTDDAALLAATGEEVALTAGEEANFKITTPDDFKRAEAHLMSQLPTIRMGTGFDVHRFGPGDHVWLCGIQVPHSHGMLAHSDGDVALHALTDAILGALADGDIGSHFPPSDPQWKGAPSWKFLDHARALVAQRGGQIAHVDVTIICERPKVGPLREAMRARISEILRCDIATVSVKATTTEGLGFTGRQEGIAAQAAATIRLP
jgi:2-C-methyl-D-erythritol 4-phosphate cytidylyltransferase / 2-C-methyl-D-erythritol 2,4-cyclodiphosphate synthase